jgi:hypothetical protein
MTNPTCQAAPASSAQLHRCATAAAVLHPCAAVAQVCDRYGCILVMDASLLADNLHFVKTREEACKDMSIREITREMVRTSSRLGQALAVIQLQHRHQQQQQQQLHLRSGCCSRGCAEAAANRLFHAHAPAAVLLLRHEK